MTIPSLHNCPHSHSGWCLECVTAAREQIAALEAKRREDVRKCEAIINAYNADGNASVCMLAAKRIRAAFPEDFK